MRSHTPPATAAAVAVAVFASPEVMAAPSLQLQEVWASFVSVSNAEPQSGVFDNAAAEIVAYDAVTGRAFVVNGHNQRVDVLNGADGSLIGPLDVSA